MFSRKSVKGTERVNIPASIITAFLLVFVLISQVGLSRSQASPALLAFSVAISSDPSSLDAPDATTPAEFQVVSQIYDTLVRYEPGGSLPVPGLAQSWANSSDGLTWTFTLRSGVTFQDSTPLDSAAVLYNFQRWWDSANLNHDGSFATFKSLFGFKNNIDPNFPDLIASLSDPTPTQFVIVLKSPAPILAFLANPALGIGSLTAIQAGTIDAHPVGSGPFAFNSWVAGSSISLIRNANYWGSKAVASGLTFKILATAAEQLAALQSNSVQSAGDISGDSLTAAQADPALQVFWRPSSVMGYLGLNRSKTPLDNLLVRQAIAHAIDKKTLAAASFYNPGTQASTQFLPTTIWGFDSSISDYSYDPTLAKSLLAQAGYASGFSIGLGYRTVSRPYMPNPDATAAAIQADLAAVNITVNLDRYDASNSDLFLPRVYAGYFEMVLLGWGADYIHPYNFFDPHFCTQFLMFGPQDNELCAKVADGLTLQTDALRLAAYKWSSQRVHDTLPLIPLVNARSPLVTRRSISGIVPAILTEDYQPAFVPSHWNFSPAILKP